jgi:hypothetical protein
LGDAILRPSRVKKAVAIPWNLAAAVWFSRASIFNESERDF